MSVGCCSLATPVDLGRSLNCFQRVVSCLSVACSSCTCVHEVGLAFARGCRMCITGRLKDKIMHHLCMLIGLIILFALYSMRAILVHPRRLSPPRLILCACCDFVSCSRPARVQAPCAHNRVGSKPMQTLIIIESGGAMGERTGGALVCPSTVCVKGVSLTSVDVVLALAVICCAPVS
mgnify:CR=1 FL=1